MIAGARNGRTRNPRGSGEELRAEILRAAKDLLKEEGHETAITLRGVARRVGIAAPSIYPHFSSPAAILQAVVVEAFGELNAFVEAAVIDLVEPRERLLAGCRAYISFGIENPTIYKLLFERNRELGGQSPEGRPPTEDDLWQGPFGQLVAAIDACIRAGLSTATSSPATALEVWVSMHGLVTLRGNRYDMPWPPREAMEPPFISALARLVP